MQDRYDMPHKQDIEVALLLINKEVRSVIDIWRIRRLQIQFNQSTYLTGSLKGTASGQAARPTSEAGNDLNEARQRCRASVPPGSACSPGRCDSGRRGRVQQ
jgi:hypothetical protein